MARTYKTLSLSLPPEAIERLTALGAPQNKTACRVAAEAVLRYLKADDATRAAVSNDDAVPSLLRGAMDSLSAALVWIEQKRRETKRKRRDVEVPRRGFCPHRHRYKRDGTLDCSSCEKTEKET